MNSTSAAGETCGSVRRGTFRGITSPSGAVWPRSETAAGDDQDGSGGMRRQSVHVRY